MSEPMQAVLEALPGATCELTPAPQGRPPPSLMFKVKGKVFAILALRGAPAVGLKCDPVLGEILRERYAGVGVYRQHLANWISVRLDADVPFEEAARLAQASYELVRAGLTRKQRAGLDALPV
jgi:predicted DNA-binding protein (MmcQ/YjbR family)